VAGPTVVPWVLVSLCLCLSSVMMGLYEVAGLSRAASEDEGDWAASAG